jgi:hypothetical protein
MSDWDWAFIKAREITENCDDIYGYMFPLEDAIAQALREARAEGMRSAAEMVSHLVQVDFDGERMQATSWADKIRAAAQTMGAAGSALARQRDEDIVKAIAKAQSEKETTK